MHLAIGLCRTLGSLYNSPPQSHTLGETKSLATKINFLLYLYYFNAQMIFATTVGWYYLYILQVEQVLTVEELLPKKLRRRFITGYKEVYPNWRKSSWHKTFQFIVWGGARYDDRASIRKVLHPPEVWALTLSSLTELMIYSEHRKKMRKSEKRQINCLLK